MGSLVQVNHWGYLPQTRWGGGAQEQISKWGCWLRWRLFQSESFRKYWSVDYTMKSVPPKARRSAHYALTLYASVADYGLLLGMGGSTGVCLMGNSRRHFPRKRGSCQVWYDKVAATGGWTQWLPNGIWVEGLVYWTEEILPHRNHWVILGKGRVESYIWWKRPF